MVSVNNPDISTLNVFPNPTSGYIQVGLGENQKGKLELFNSTGQKIIDAKIETNPQALYIPYTARIYFVKIKTRDLARVVKVVKF